MSENRDGMTVDRAVAHVIESMERAVAEQLANYATGIDAINRVGVISQKMATQRMVLGVSVRVRIALEQSVRDAGDNAPLVMTLKAQAESFDDEVAAILAGVGMPQKAVRAALDAAAEQVRVEVYQRDEKGRIHPLRAAN